MKSTFPLGVLHIEPSTRTLRSLNDIDTLERSETMRQDSITTEQDIMRPG